MVVSRARSQRPKCSFKLGPGGVQRDRADDPRVAAIGETAAGQAFLVVEVGVPVADIKCQRLPVIGNAGRPGELLEGFRVLEELVADAGVDREIVRQRHLEAAGYEGRGVAALVEVRCEEDASTQREPVLEIVVRLGEQLAIVRAHILWRIEVVDIAEVERKGPELGPDADSRVDLGAFEAFAEIDVGGPDVEIDRSDAGLDIALDGGIVAGIGNAAGDVVGRKRNPEPDVKRESRRRPLRCGFSFRRCRRDGFDGLLDGKCRRRHNSCGREDP